MKFFQRLRGRTLVRYVGFAFMLIVALLAAAIVTSVTVDLGPAVRAKAESAGTDYLDRPNPGPPGSWYSGGNERLARRIAGNLDHGVVLAVR